MFKTDNLGQPRPLRALARGAGAGALSLCLLLVPLQVRTADASDRGRRIAIGAGIVGAIIASELSRKQVAERRTYKRRAATSRTKVASRSKSRRHRHAAKSKPEQARHAVDARAPEPEAASVAPQASTTGAVISTPEEIISAQQHLQYIGYDIPSPSGALDLKTKVAIMQFQESIGAPTTGVLTVEQLQTLFLKAAERHAGGK